MCSYDVFDLFSSFMASLVELAFVIVPNIDSFLLVIVVTDTFRLRGGDVSVKGLFVCLFVLYGACI